MHYESVGLGGVVLLGAKDKIIGSSPNGDTIPDSNEVSIASPTKEHDVLIFF